MQTVSVYFVFDYIRGVIYSMWKAISKTFHCKFMHSSKSMYINFYMSIIIVSKTFHCKFMLSSKSTGYVYYLLHEYYNCI